MERACGCSAEEESCVGYCSIPVESMHETVAESESNARTVAQSESVFSQGLI